MFPRLYFILWREETLEEMYKMSILVQQRHPMDANVRKPLITLILTFRLVEQGVFIAKLTLDTRRKCHLLCH